MTKTHQSTPAIDPWLDFQALCRLGGRLSGTASEAGTQVYLTQRLTALSTRYGGHFASIPVAYMGWQAHTGRLESEATDDTIPGQPLLYSPSTGPEGLKTKVVDLGRGTEADFRAKRDQIPGRIVLTRHEFMFGSDHIHRNRKYEWALKYGAAGFLIANQATQKGLVAGGLGLSGESASIPAMGISHTAAEMLGGHEEGNARLVIETTTRPATTETLIYERAGETPEWVVLSAHLDGHSLAQSAIDNATGVAAAIASTESLLSTKTLQRGIRLCLFSIEEWGLLASKHYLSELNKKDLESIVLNVNLDSVAGADGLTAFYSDYPALRRFLKGCAETNQIPLSLYGPLVPNSDHYNFAVAGIPAFRLLAGFEAPGSNMRYVLTEEDTIDKVTPEQLNQAVEFTTAVMSRACDSPTLLLRESR